MSNGKKFASAVAIGVVVCPGLVSYSYFLAFAASCGVPERLALPWHGWAIPLWPLFWGSVEGLAFVALVAFWQTKNARVRVWAILIACVAASGLVGFVHPLTHDAQGHLKLFPWPYNGFGGMVPAICWPLALWLAHLVRGVETDRDEGAFWTRFSTVAGDRLISMVQAPETARRHEREVLLPPGRAETLSPGTPLSPAMGLSVDGGRMTGPPLSQTELVSQLRNVVPLSGRDTPSQGDYARKMMELTGVSESTARRKVHELLPLLEPVNSPNGHGGPSHEVD
jgi:hypothetical protein